MIRMCGGKLGIVQLLLVILFIGSGYTVTVQVTAEADNVNNSKPEFERSSYTTIIDENTAQGRTILKLKATDKDAGDNGRVGYRMARPRNREEIMAHYYFGVYASDGEANVVIKNTVDIDKRPILYYRFTVIAFDHGASPMESEAQVIIRVRDVNDNKPNIKINYLQPDRMLKTRGLLMENEEKVFVALVTVSDRDSGPGGIVSCRVGNDRFYLQDIQRTSNSYKSSSSKTQTKKYKLLTRQGIDREQESQVSFPIICHDNAVSQKAMTKLESTARVDLRIIDQNDEKPEFTEEQYTFYLRENLSKRDSEVQVGQVKAMDKDEGNNAKISYILADDGNSAFRVERDTGVIYAHRSFDRELTEQILLVVKAIDGGSPRQQTATAEVKVIISDVNDNPPIFKASDYHFTVVENSRALKVGQVEATDEDRDENAQVEYKIIDDRINSETRKYFSINRHSGIIHLSSRLDRERKEQYVFNVIAVDRPNPGQQRNTGTATVTVTVLDENDNRPKILHPKNNADEEVDETDPIGKEIFTMKAVDPDKGVNGTVSYSIVPGSYSIVPGSYSTFPGAEDNFAIDKNTGILYLMRKLEGYRNKLFSLVLMARDNGRGVSLNSTVTVRIRVKRKLSLPKSGCADVGDTGRSFIVMAAIVLLLLM